MPPIAELLQRCLEARLDLIDAAHDSAFRLFNGFTEGLPQLVIDIYGSTAILTNYANPPVDGEPLIADALDFVQTRLSWVRSAILKTRAGSSPEERRGVMLFGEGYDEKVREHGVWYAVNPVVHQDAGLYLDTRNLRLWALKNLRDRAVLNTFAYTGSLGVAALVGGACRVMQSDHNKAFLQLAKRSCELNGLRTDEEDYLQADFFRLAGSLKRQNALFDCVFLDPPFFSASTAGVVDQVHENARVINKVRPLIRDEGTLVAINNAVYVSGRQYMDTLEALCADGYLRVVELIPVPEDFTGYPGTRLGSPITDPAPFNHSTKIAILQVKRKQS